MVCGNRFSPYRPPAGGFKVPEPPKLGVPVVFFATIAGTATFGTLQAEAANHFLLLLIGFVSISAAVLAGLQTFFGYAEMAEKHKTAAGKYGRLRRKFEQELVLAPSKAADILKSLRPEWDKLDENSPNISEAVYQKSAQRAHEKAAAIFS
jgi:hypothetical protein